MSYRTSALRLLAISMMGIAGLSSSAGRLRAQDQTGVDQGAPAPVTATAASQPGLSATPAPAAQAGPRVAPPLQQYRPSLPADARSESRVMDSGGGRHTIVLSTLALVLIVVIVVLLAVD